MLQYTKKYKVIILVTILVFILPFLLVSNLLIDRVKIKVENFIDTRCSNLIHQKTSTDKVVLSKLNDYSYARFYSNARKNNLYFDQILSDISSPNLSSTRRDIIEQICLFEVEDGIDRRYISKGYDCLSRIQASKQNLADTFRSIKNSSYALDVMYNKMYVQNLITILIKDYEKEVNQLSQKLGQKDLRNFFTGYSQDEVPFLLKLTELEIPSLSAKVLYRLSMISNLGRSSSLEDSKPDYKKAVADINKVLSLTNLSAVNKVNIVFTVNDKYSAHAAAVIVSALINSDLDTLYSFYFAMDPDDQISKESQQKLSSMQHIRKYNIDFMTVDHSLIPLELIRKKAKATFDKGFPTLIAYRPFLDKILPNLDNVLSLDGDLLVFRDLSYFTRIDMQGNYVAAVYDAGTPWVTQLPNSYINAGVMWFNLKDIRSDNGNKIIVEEIQKTSLPLDLFEQDILTHAFKDKLYFLSHRWNHTPNYTDSTINTNYYTKFVLHYSGFKPWNKSKADLTELDKEYWRFRELTPWPVDENYKNL